MHVYLHPGFLGGASGKEHACPCRRHKRHGFDPWISWGWTPAVYPNINFYTWVASLWASLVAQMVKNPPAMQETQGFIPGLGRPPRGEHGNPLQYSCLENPMDRGAWWAISP